MTLGANVGPDGVTFRVWAPKRSRIEVVFTSSATAPERVVPLDRGDGGYFEGVVPGIGAGTRYRYRIDGGQAFPDPCSRFQPEGPEGASLVVDPTRYAWRQRAWPGISMRGQVIYEMHVGAFTPAGTLDAAADELPELARLGVTLIELMPLAEFPGRFNWGYDGVDLFAPCHVYGDPDALRRFVDRAHSVGLGVVLDVVYNHVGPSGCCLRQFSEEYFTSRYENEWGEAINFDGEGAAAVREFVIQNACYWITEYRLDGLRLDATQSVHDASPEHVLAELSRRTRAAAGDRSIVLIGENEPQDIVCLAPVEAGGYGLDAVWSDDFHHTARVALTGRREAYYTDYLGSAQEFVSLAKRCFLYQGQRYAWQKKLRGTPVTTEPASSFVFYLQNHDQIANHPRGERLHQQAAAGAWRALTATLLLAPQTPMLFMGQEFAASSPFLFFADHGGDLRQAVRRGRREFLAQFPSYATPATQASLPDPADPDTFARSRLDLGERERHAEAYRLYADLLALRREDAVLAAQRRDALDGAVFGPTAFVLRWFGAGDAPGDRLLAVNLGAELRCEPAPEPLLAPPAGMTWQLAWSSDDPRYGGPGVVDPSIADAWHFPGEGATFFVSAPASPPAQERDQS